jgi:hypothetical protein
VNPGVLETSGEPELGDFDYNGEGSIVFSYPDAIAIGGEDIQVRYITALLKRTKDRNRH